VESYRELRVWQVGMDLAVACYRLTAAFPPSELYGLTSQIRRAASAIPANIAEGYGRRGRGDYLRFIGIAQGSLAELEIHLLLAQHLELGAETEIQSALVQADQIGRMLSGLHRSLESRSASEGR
jgi:four helix bundle protein